MKYTLDFDQISINDLPKVGGKNASLGEMFRNLSAKGINVPDGFAVTADAYNEFLDKNNVRNELETTLSKLDKEHHSNLTEIGEKLRRIILQCEIPLDIAEAIKAAYTKLKDKFEQPIQIAVRSSATAEDLPTASFAGQQETFLNVRNEDELLKACLKCYASLFTNRAIKYRDDNGFKHMEVALSIGVQKMVRSDKASAGVCFTLDTDTGFRDVILINSSWGLGENVVKGEVNPDEYLVFKPSLQKGKLAILSKKIGDKSKTMIYSEEKEEKATAFDPALSQESSKATAFDPNLTSEVRKSYNDTKLSTVNIDTPRDKQEIFTLTDHEVEQLAKWAMVIEEYYNTPMDIEWAKDGVSGELCIVQARPETVHANLKKDFEFSVYTLKSEGKVLTKGKNVGTSIAAGKARILASPEEIDQLKKGEVLVTEITNPDWDPILKKASAIITNKGGRTSHAAIVAREIGAVAVVGTGNATQVIKDGQEVTISCIDGKEGIVYDGILEWDEEKLDPKTIKMPETEVMFILANPDQAFNLSFTPNNGVGLLRIEFMISNTIQIHPMALVKYDELEDLKAKEKIAELTKRYDNKSDYFVDHLSQGVAMIAAAFYPKDVIVRMSDFKTNEYANLIGGKAFEPDEENPMLGWRGASRYYSEGYKEGFKLECEAMKRVRDDMGLTNVKLMIPFCRTVEEGKKVVNIMRDFGLERGKNGLELYVMIEIPNNVILAEEFAQHFDGFSIGSNDLTQLTLGIERDSALLSDLFDVKDQGVKKTISSVIRSAIKTNTKIGFCGQAPSDFPEYAQFLVNEGIDAISFSPDALLKGIENINIAEKKKKTEAIVQ